MTERHHAPGAEERLSEEAEKAARIVREDAAAAEAVAEREVSGVPGQGGLGRGRLVCPP